MISWYRVTTLLAAGFVIMFAAQAGRLDAQSPTPEGMELEEDDDKSKGRKEYEQIFGDQEDNLQTVSEVVEFAELVFKKAKSEPLRSYAYRKLLSILKKHKTDPDAFKYLIRLQRRRQDIRYDRARQQKIIELLKKRARAVQGSWNRLMIVKSLIRELHRSALQAIDLQDWKSAQKDYGQIKRISDNFKRVFQSGAAERMISRVKRRKQFETKTADLVQRAYDTPENGALHQKTGEKLLRLNRWSHALTFLQKARQAGQSSPLMKAVQIALNSELQDVPDPEIVVRYLLDLNSIIEETSNEPFEHACIKAGLSLFRPFSTELSGLSDGKRQNLLSVIRTWQNRINEIDRNVSLTLGPEPPHFVLYPRENLLLYAPGNSNAKDYSEHNRNASVRSGAMVNPGVGIKGAFQLAGRKNSNTNAVVFEELAQEQFIEQEFSIAFWFKRHFFTSAVTNNNVGNVMVTVSNAFQIGTVGEFFQIYLNTSRQPTFQLNGGLKNNRWYHLAVTFRKSRSNELHLYLNGNLANKWSHPQGNIKTSNSSVPVIGCSWKNPAAYAGLIDDFFLYNRALSDREINILRKRSIPE